MRKSAGHTSHHPATITVGQLISELCRWPDNAEIAFRCPAQNREMHFHRVEGRSKGRVEVDLVLAPESPPIVPA
jgi:hypothetical protein